VNSFFFCQLRSGSPRPLQSVPVHLPSLPFFPSIVILLHFVLQIYFTIFSIL
ncbi:uncharacterized protein BO96DRAFT_386643, partial [Aspergillus niger CBS 101883]|uniref:uncharacterized protein n=1 Tax=Aspergillus lacticoffeatus (strain CBS 101883) TaxID=1450533 RepID=UPI000D801BD7